MRAEGSGDTEGFGCPKSVDPHHFRVEVPPGRDGVVLIAEHYGIKAGIGAFPKSPPAATCRAASGGGSRTM